MPRSQEPLGVVAEVQEAALAAERVVVAVVADDQALRAGRVRVDAHAADGILVRLDLANFMHALIVARSQHPVMHDRERAR